MLVPLLVTKDPPLESVEFIISPGAVKSGFNLPSPVGPRLLNPLILSASVPNFPDCVEPTVIALWDVPGEQIDDVAPVALAFVLQSLFPLGPLFPAATITTLPLSEAISREFERTSLPSLVSSFPPRLKLRTLAFSETHQSMADFTASVGAFPVDESNTFALSRLAPKLIPLVNWSVLATIPATCVPCPSESSGLFPSASFVTKSFSATTL